MKYKNTQLGTVMLSLMLSVTGLLIFSAINKPDETIWPAFIIVGVSSLLFCSLTIRITKDKITWFFGPYFWKKKLKLEEIHSVKIIRTKWYFGFGIRLVSSGWLYNVSGLDAVELTLKDGTTISLGTNQANELQNAINAKLENN